MQNNSMLVTQTVVTLPAGVSTQVVPAVAIGRNYLAIINVGANDASLGFSATAVAGQGWPLYAAGGGYTMTNAEGVPTNLINAISTSGTTLVVLVG